MAEVAKEMGDDLNHQSFLDRLSLGDLGVVFKDCVCYFSTIFYFSPNYSPSKTMKDVFYFI